MTRGRYSLLPQFEPSPPECWAILVVTAVHNLLFVAYIRIDWVRVAAEAYARQLLAACDSLEREMHT